MTVAVVILASLITAACGLMTYIVLHAVLHQGTLHLTYTERDEETK